jgi:hypothetical protein
MNPDPNDQEKHDRAVEDSFPASDPPATGGVTGPRVVPPRQDGEDEEAKPKGRPTDERHVTETGYQRQDEERPKD